MISLFYGWFILIILCINYVVMTGGTLYTYGVILLPMAGELGLTMTQAAAGQTMKTILTSVFSLLAGQLMAKYMKPKTAIVLGCLFGVVTGGLLSYVVSNPNSYFLCYPLFISLMTSFGGLLASQVMVTHWFTRYRSTAVSILLAMGGVGGFVYPQISNALVNSTGWRSVYTLLMVSCAVCAVLSFLFLKDTPQQMGLLPDGAKPGMEERTLVKKESSYRTKVSFTQKETLLTPFFYVCVITHVCTTNGASAMGSYLVAHLTQFGLPASVGATAVSIYAFFNIFGRALSGVIQDHINPRTMLKVLLPMMALSLFFTPYLATPMHAWLFAGFFGLCLSLAVPCPVGVLMNTFGVEHYSQIFSIENFLCNILNALFALIPGLIFDSFGSYRNFFYILAALMLTSTVLQMLFPTPVKKTVPEQVR